MLQLRLTRGGDEPRVDQLLELGGHVAQRRAQRIRAAPREPGGEFGGLTQDLREELSLPDSAKGLAVVNVDESSEAFEKGLRQGDVITEAGQSEVLSISDLETKVDEAKEAGRKSLLLLVRRGGDPRFVALSLEEQN